MSDFFEQLENYLFFLTSFESSEGYYRFIDTACDDGNELLIFKLVTGDHWCGTYNIIPRDGFDLDKMTKCAKQCSVELSEDRNPTGRAQLVVDRNTGIATLVPSHKSSDVVISELADFSKAIVGKHCRGVYEDMTFEICWKRGGYNAQLV